MAIKLDKQSKNTIAAPYPSPTSVIFDGPSVVPSVSSIPNWVNVVLTSLVFGSIPEVLPNSTEFLVYLELTEKLNSSPLPLA